MDATALCKHRLTERDASALIGVLATLEGHLISGTIDPGVVDHLRRRLVRDRVIAVPARADVLEALHGLNQAVRTALGEYD